LKTLAAPALAVLGNRLAMAQLVAMDLTVPIYVTTSRDSIDWGGHTYVGGRQTAIDSIKDQGGEVQGLSFQLSGVPNDLLAIALAEPIQGKAVRVYTAIMDADTLAILDVQPSWAGTLDQMPITQGIETSVITVTAEHRGIAFARPKGIRYTDGDQQALVPGDLSLEFIVAQASHQDVWPSAAFFRQ
jgi:hypothetical protein